MAIAISHPFSEYRISTQYLHVWFSYSWKQLFAAGSITEVKQKLFQQRSLCRVPTLVWLNNRYCNGMGVTAMLQCMMQLSFTIVMWRSDFNWYCQLSGSRSNSLNLCKLQGHFSYGLGTRLQVWMPCISHIHWPPLLWHPACWYSPAFPVPV